MVRQAFRAHLAKSFADRVFQVVFKSPHQVGIHRFSFALGYIAHA
jgi:hypothetical protein